MIDKGICEKGSIWNSGNCKCECDKSCNAVEYLDYENCKCRGKLIDKSVKEFSQNIDGNEMIYNKTLNDYRNIYGSCTIYIVLFTIFFMISISISSVFIYFHWCLKKSSTNINSSIETVIY